MMLRPYYWYYRNITGVTNAWCNIFVILMFYGRNIFSLPLQSKWRRCLSMSMRRVSFGINKIRFTCIYNKVRNEEENVFVDGTHDGVDGNECPEFRKKLCWEGHWEFRQDHDHWWNHPLKVWVPDRRGGGTIRGAYSPHQRGWQYYTWGKL